MHEISDGFSSDVFHRSRRVRRAQNSDCGHHQSRLCMKCHQSINLRQRVLHEVVDELNTGCIHSSETDCVLVLILFCLEAIVASEYP